MERPPRRRDDRGQARPRAARADRGRSLGERAARGGRFRATHLVLRPPPPWRAWARCSSVRPGRTRPSACWLPQGRSRPSTRPSTTFAGCSARPCSVPRPRSGARSSLPRCAGGGRQLARSTGAASDRRPPPRRLGRAGPRAGPRARARGTPVCRPHGRHGCVECVPQRLARAGHRAGGPHPVRPQTGPPSSRPQLSVREDRREGPAAVRTGSAPLPPRVGRRSRAPASRGRRGGAGATVGRDLAGPRVGPLLLLGPARKRGRPAALHAAAARPEREAERRGGPDPDAECPGGPACAAVPRRQAVHRAPGRAVGGGRDRSGR